MLLSRWKGWLNRTKYGFAILLFCPLPALANGIALSIEGQVGTAQGSVPAGTQVELMPVLSHFESSRGLLSGSRGPAAVAEASPEPDSGHFRLEVPAIGLYRVRVTAPGFLPMRSLPLPVTGIRELPPLTLRPALTLGATIHDAGGRPVPGAWLTARASADGRELWREQGSPGWLVAPRLARSNSAGRATLLRLASELLDVEVHILGDVTPRRFSGIDAGLEIRLPPDPVPRREIVLAEAETGVLVSLGEAQWPVGELDAEGRLNLAGRFEDRVVVHLLGPGRPRRSTWLESGKERTVIQHLPVHRFAGRLVDSQGRPLAGALVWPRWDPGAQVLTDERGGFSFPRPLASRFEIWGAAPGFAPGRLALTHQGVGRGEVPDLKLHAAATASGRVLDAAGHGVAGVLVMASPGVSELRRDVAPVYATTASDGRFELHGLTAGLSHQLIAERQGYFAAALDIGSIRPGGRRGELRFVLAARRGAFGRVVDLEDRPLADIEVVLRPSAGSPVEPERTRTDREGRFEVAALPAPKVDLIASGEGYAPLTVPGVGPGLGVGVGPIDLGTLLLEPGQTLIGEVQAAGEPVAGAELWISERPVAVERLAWQALSRLPPAAVSDRRGRFVVNGLGSGQRVDLVVFHSGFLPTVVRRVAAPTLTPVQVELRPAARVSGQVLSEDLEPIVGASITLSAGELPEGVSAIPAPIEHDPEHGTRSGPDGTFEITTLPSGAVVLNVLAMGFQPAAEQRFQLAEGERVDGLEILLERGASVGGRVTRADGSPVEDAGVRFGRVMTHTEADGHFQLDGVVVGRGLAEVWHPHFDRLERQVEIEPGSQVFDFVFASTQRLGGQVVDERGRAVVDAAIELTRIDRHGYQQPKTLTDGQGRFNFPHLAGGRYGLKVEKLGWVPVEPDLQIELENGSVEDLEVVMAASGRLSGEILGLDFVDLAGVRVTALGDDGRRRHGEVSYDGRYQIEQLAPGDWRVTADAAEGQRQAEVRVVLTPGELELHRDLEFEPGLVLSGRVEHQGEPVQAAQVALRGRDVVAQRSLKADHEGRFRFEALEPGSYRLGVSSRRELLIHNQDVSLESDRDLLIELASAGLTGRVVTEDGGGVHDAMVVLRQLLRTTGERAEGSIFTVGTDVEGRFRFERLPAGYFRVRMLKDGYSQLEKELEVVAGEVDDAGTFVLEPTSGLELHLRLASGKVPSSALVTLLDGGRPIQSEARSLVGGAVRFETLPPGHWQALISAAGGAPREVTLTVPGDPVEVVLQDAGRVRVRVPTLFDSPQRATLTLEDAVGRSFVGLDGAGRPQRTWWVDRGAATLEGVPAGLWTLRLVSTEGWERVGSVATPGHSEIEVVLD